MKQVIIITPLLIFLISCVSPHIIKTTNNELFITLEKNTLIKGKGTLIYKDNINLTHLNIEQNVFIMGNNQVLIYEEAIVNNGYKFNYGMKRTINIIFPNYKARLLKRKANIHFFELINKRDIEYLILENMNKKRLKIIYGFDKETLNIICNSLIDIDIDIDNNMSYSNSLPFLKIKKDTSSYIKSKWSIKNIVLDNILAKKSTIKVKK